MLGARLSHTERACCNRQVLCLDLLCLYLDRCSASTWASSARCSRASSSRCLACARSETQKHTHTQNPQHPFFPICGGPISPICQKSNSCFFSRKMLERSFFFLYTRGGRTAFLVLVMAIAWSCKHVSFITKVCSLTRPISPTCPRPFFPYLTFEFFFLGIRRLQRTARLLRVQLACAFEAVRCVRQRDEGLVERRRLRY